LRRPQSGGGGDRHTGRRGGRAMTHGVSLRVVRLWHRAPAGSATLAQHPQAACMKHACKLNSPWQQRRTGPPARARWRWSTLGGRSGRRPASAPVDDVCAGRQQGCAHDALLSCPQA
jgi:hypothetical protein